jgi:hypothetical protein
MPPVDTLRHTYSRALTAARLNKLGVEEGCSSLRIFLGIFAENFVKKFTSLAGSTNAA